MGDDHPLAGCVHHDSRHRRGGTGDAHHACRADAFARHLGHELIADRVISVAERPRVMRAPAEPRHRDRSVHRAAAADDRGARWSCTLPPGGGNCATRNTMSCTAIPAHRIDGALEELTIVLHPRADDVVGDGDRRLAWSARRDAFASASPRIRPC